MLHETVRRLLNEELKLATLDAESKGRPNPGCLVISRQTLLNWLANRKHKANLPFVGQKENNEDG